MLQGRQTIMGVCLLGEVFDFHSYTVQHVGYMCIAMYITCMAFYVYLYVTRGMWDVLLL